MSQNTRFVKVHLYNAANIISIYFFENMYSMETTYGMKKIGTAHNNCFEKITNFTSKI
jgi:hypothetical protein